MPTPSSGQISFANIASISKGNSTSEVSLGEPTSRQLSGVSSGQISITSFYNKPASGSNTYNPGTYTFLCPPYQILNLDIRGAGGGGAGGGGIALLIPVNGKPGANGGNSSFNSSTPVIAGGGIGGGGSCYSGTIGANGTGSGGVDQGPGGGAGASGGLGALLDTTRYCSGLAGGVGNRQTKSWAFNSTAGYPIWSDSYTVLVGQGGLGGNGSSGGANGANGANGSVSISWS